jgi:hypothetical protein
MTRLRWIWNFPGAPFFARLRKRFSGGDAMNVRRLLIAAMMLSIGALLGRTVGPALAQDDNKAQALGAQLADAQLKLAEMNLARAQELNQKVPGTLIAGMMQQFVEEVERARSEVQIVKKTPEGDPYQACIQRVRLALRAAEARAKVGLETHEKAPSVVTRGDVERMRLFAEITDLQLQRGLALANGSPGDKLRWQLEVLGDDLDRVRIYTYLLGQNRVGQFFPGGL